VKTEGVTGVFLGGELEEETSEFDCVKKGIIATGSVNLFFFQTLFE